MQFARFLVVGAANTAASYSLYLLLLLVVDYRLAYTIAYVAGLVGGYLAHARFVFGARPDARSAASYAATYGAMYVASLLVLYVVVDRLSVPKAFGMLAALALTVPASFLLLRRGFRRHSPGTTMAPPQFLRYAGAGAIGTAAQYGVLIALVQLGGVGALAASTAGAVVGALVNYTLNHRYTFASGRAHRMALPRFLVVAGAGVLLNAAVLATLLATVQLHYLLMQVVATGAVLVAGYAANRRWTF